MENRMSGIQRMEESAKEHVKSHYHDSDLSEISLLEQKANYRWRILVMKMRQKANASAADGPRV